MNSWTASGAIPLEAVIVKWYVPAVPGGGVPESVAVPFPLSVNVTPVGSVADPSLRDGAGEPVVVTVNVPDWPWAKVAPPALVICGADWGVMA
jgi:hypothetical protein